MTEPGAGTDPPGLFDTLVRRIRADGPMPFAAFMDAALHDPEHGYYASGPGRLGPAGDFFTASDVGTAFGECVARQLEEMDEALGRPATFHAIEFGAGRGLLARDVIDALRAERSGLSSRLRYVAVDRSRGMRDRIRVQVPEAELSAPDQAGDHARDRQGCVLAVELFDALPVHRVRRRSGTLVEVVVGVEDRHGRPQLVEREAAPSAEVESETARWGLSPEDGDEAEVCLALASQFRALASALTRGFLIVVDYGHDATELAGRAHRRGTLLSYHRHRTSESFLDHVGEQDLTAHVNWTALGYHAREAGWIRVGRTTQDRFLIANGILERFEQPDEAARRDPARVKGRMQAMQLIHPHGMGRAFEVHVFMRGLDGPPRLAGLADPFAR